jgi:hypothetical protein
MDGIIIVSLVFLCLLGMTLIQCIESLGWLVRSVYSDNMCALLSSYLV